MFYAIIGIAVFALMFPKAFAVVKSIFLFFWNILGNIVMFFVNLFGGIASGVLWDGLSGLLGGIGKLTAPLENLMSGVPSSVLLL